MLTIQTTITLTPGSDLVLKLPPDMPAGDYQIVLVMESQPTKQKRPPIQFPVDDYGKLLVDLSLRREDIYGEFGR